MVPLEQPFIRFTTPEAAFNYSYDPKCLMKIINDTDIALAIYNNGDDALSYVLFNKDNKGWIMNNNSDEVNLKVVDKYFLISAKSYQNNKAMILICNPTVNNQNSEISVSDSKESKFEKFNFEFQRYTNFYRYAIIEIPDPNYIITIEGNAEQIALS